MRSISHTPRVSPSAFLFRVFLKLCLVLEIALNRVPADLGSAATEVLNQNKPSQSQKRSMLLRKGIPRSVADELEVLTETGQCSNVLFLVSQLKYSSKRRRC